MSEVNREEFIELVKRQDAAEQRDREMSQDIKQIRCDTAEVVEMFVALPWVPVWLLIVLCAGYAAIAGHNWIQARA